MRRHAQSTSCHKWHGAPFAALHTPNTQKDSRHAARPAHPRAANEDRSTHHAHLTAPPATCSSRNAAGRRRAGARIPPAPTRTPAVEQNAPKKRAGNGASRLFCPPPSMATLPVLAPSYKPPADCYVPVPTMLRKPLAQLTNVADSTHHRIAITPTTASFVVADYLTPNQAQSIEADLLGTAALHWCTGH